MAQGDQQLSQEDLKSIDRLVNKSKNVNSPVQPPNLNSLNPNAGYMNNLDNMLNSNSYMSN